MNPQGTVAAWPTVPLGEMLTFLTSGSRGWAQYYADMGSPFLRIQNVGRNQILLNDVAYVSAPGTAEANRTRVQPGDVLLSITADLGRTAVVPPSIDGGYINQHLAILRVRSIDPTYLSAYLSSPDGQRQIMGRNKHGVKAGLNFEDIRSFMIPIPPLSEQRRIAEVLDRAEALRAKRRAALAHLDTLTQSIFLSLFGDPVTNSKGWNEGTPLGEISDIASGITKGRKVNGEAVRPVPYMAVVNVQDRAIDLTTVKTIEATDNEIARYRLQVDDLLLTEGGDPDKLGRGSLWKGELPECIHQNHVFRVRLTSKDVQPLFLNWLVGSQRGKRYFLKSAKQTTGIATINMTQLRSFPLILPPLPLQREFAAQIAAVENLKSAHRASLAKLDELFASLQHRAFRGEL